MTSLQTPIFCLVEEEECHNPYVLTTGWIAATAFLQCIFYELKY